MSAVKGAASGSGGADKGRDQRLQEIREITHPIALEPANKPPQTVREHREEHTQTHRHTRHRHTQT